MSKLWTQWDEVNGGWIPWEANTLPSGQSLFRARFLSQFVSWIRYLGAMEGLPREDIDFVYPGTVIQRASFWNLLNWQPSAAWLDIREEEVVAGTTIADATSLLIDSDDYMDTMYTPVEAGQVIQPYQASTCPMRNMMEKLRRRIDMCYSVGLSEYNLMRRGQVRRHYWTVIGGSGEFSEDILYSTINESYLYPNGCATRYARYNIPPSYGMDMFAARNISIKPFAGMPTETVIGSVLYYIDRVSAGWSTTFPVPDSVLPSRIVEAVGINPIGDEPQIIIEAGVENTAHLYPASGTEDIVQVRAGMYHPLSTPPEDYQPDEDLMSA